MLLAQFDNTSTRTYLRQLFGGAKPGESVSVRWGKLGCPLSELSSKVAFSLRVSKGLGKLQLWPCEGMELSNLSEKNDCHLTNKYILLQSTHSVLLKHCEAPRQAVTLKFQRLDQFLDRIRDYQPAKPSASQPCNVRVTSRGTKCSPQRATASP